MDLHRGAWWVPGAARPWGAGGWHWFWRQPLDGHDVRSAAQAHVALVEQRLLAKFDVLYGRYLVAHNQVLRFRSTILPQTRETQELIGEGYRQGDLRFLDYLTAQRTFYQSNLRYLDVLQEYWRSLNLLNGLLLNESLASRP